MSHGRFDFVPITRRPSFEWPDGRRLAVYIALNVEAYRFGQPMIEELVPAGPQPDILNYSWCEYGNRVAVWRLLQLSDEVGLPLTGLLNAYLYRSAPEIPQAFRDRDYEIGLPRSDELRTAKWSARRN